MSAQLNIRFGAAPGEAASAPIAIEVINAELELHRAGVYRIEDTATITVEPGRYLVRGRLPSGEWLSEQTSVEEGAAADVVLAPQRTSPHEHLAWGYYLRANPLIEDSSTSRRARTESLLIDFAPGPVTYRIWRHAALQAWAPIGEGVVGAGVDARVEALHPFEDPRGLGVISVDPSSFGPGEPSGEQYWLALQGDWFEPRFVALPITSRPSRVLLRFIGRQTGDNDPLQVIVDAQDPIVEALLGFITSGDYGAARTIGNSHLPEAEALLLNKTTDRMAASVGAYFLLLAGELGRTHDWCRNLDAWFPALPDGAVIHAWHLLRTGGSPELARERLIAAAARGIPYYTCGLRLLVDGLMLFLQQAPAREATAASQHDLRNAWESIARYAEAADWTQPTTTAFGAEPAMPRVPRRREQPKVPSARTPEERLLAAIFNRPETNQVVDLGNEVIIGGVRLRKRQVLGSLLDAAGNAAAARE